MKPAISVPNSGTGSVFVSRLLKKPSEIILDEKTREAQIDFVSKYGDLIDEVNRNQTPLIFDWVSKETCSKYYPLLEQKIKKKEKNYDNNTT